MNIDQCLALFLARHPAGRLRVGFSGGRDSTVLLASLSRMPQARARDLLAVHINHGLHAEAERWAEHACAVAKQLDLRCAVESVQVLDRAEVGLEARARAARREVYRRHLDPGDWMLLAHHQRDQAETVMLRLLAGAGPRGLAAMAEVSDLPPGRLGRPLLAVTDDEMQTRIEALGLPWLRDPANADAQHERSWLRGGPMCALRERKPALDAGLARQAHWMRELDAWLQEMADGELRGRLLEDGSLSLRDWFALREPLRHALLGRFLELQGAPRPGAVLLAEFERALVDAREDANPAIPFGSGVLRRYRDTLHWVASHRLATLPAVAVGQLGVPADLGAWQLHSDPDPGSPATEPAGTAWRISRREGGERIRLRVDGPSQRLKTLLQSLGLPVWQRSSLLLLWLQDDLVAVLDTQADRVLLSSDRLRGWRLSLRRSAP